MPSNINTMPILFYTDLTATSLSLFGSLFMCYHCFKASSTRISIKLIFALAIADFFYSIANLMAKFEDVTNITFCQTEAIMRGMSLFLSIFFATSTALVCYKPVLAQDNSIKSLFFWKVVCLGLGISLILFVLLPILFRAQITILQGDHFCWISSKESKTMALSVLMLHEGIPLLVGFIITLSAYWYAMNQIRELPVRILNELSVPVQGLLWYPALLLIIFIPSLIDKIWALYNPFRPVWIQTLYLCLTHSIGLMNALVYGIQRKLYAGRESNYKRFTNELSSPQKRLSSSSSISFVRESL